MSSSAGHGPWRGPQLSQHCRDDDTIPNMDLSLQVFCFLVFFLIIIFFLNNHKTDLLRTPTNCLLSPGSITCATAKPYCKPCHSAAVSVMANRDGAVPPPCCPRGLAPRCPTATIQHCSIWVAAHRELSNTRSPQAQSHTSTFSAVATSALPHPHRHLARQLSGQHCAPQGQKLSVSHGDPGVLSPFT